MLKKFGMVVSVVALLTLALVGCKNGMLGEDEATVNGEREAGGRTAKVTITNFAQNGNGATRSVVGGPLRTIAPEDIPVSDLENDYVLVATGYNSRKSMTPKIISVDSNGNTDLSGLDSGIWTIKVTAYDKVILQAADPDYANKLDQIDVLGATSVRLSGHAIVDLTRSNSGVLITLTSAGVGTQGTVNLTINLNQNDLTVIASKRYKVTLGIYDRITGDLINNAEVDASIDAQAQRVLVYNPGTMPTGEYNFKITIEEDAQKEGRGPWTWTDVILIDGNRETSDTLTIEQLIGEAPKAPTNFAAYWDTANTVANSYTVTFAWDRASFNESNFELQLLKISDKFTSVAGGNNTQYNGVTVTTADGLWTEIVKEPAKETEGILNAANFATTNFPIYAKNGTLNAGGTSVSYKLLSGEVYAVRIRSTNNDGTSDWVQIGTVDPASKPVALTAERFESFFVNVVDVTYNLQNFMLLKDGANNPYNNLGDKISSRLQRAQFKPGTVLTLDLAVNTGSTNFGGQTYRLYKADFTDTAQQDKSIIGWDKWLNELDKTPYTNEYNGFKNITLIPGGGGSTNSAIIDILTSGTHATLLTNDTVWLSVEATQGAVVTWAGKKIADHLAGAVNLATASGQTAARLGHITLNTKSLAIELVAQPVGQAAFLMFNVGTAEQSLGKFTDPAGIERTADQVTYTIEDKQGNVLKKAVGTTQSNVELTGMNSGNYVLRVVARAGEFSFSHQVPLIIKYTDEAITP